MGLSDKPKIAISFSGGRSSAVMTKLLFDECSKTHDLSIVFANTGSEDWRTLDFVHQCDVTFEWGVVWVEAVINPEHRQPSSFRIVSYDTASRYNEPFEAAVAKYGIFNATAKSCTTKLKELPMTAYRESIGFFRGKALNYDTALGIRADEIDRVSGNAARERLIYPLVKKGITKRDVAIEIKKWGFDLQIPGDHFGNCRFCYKKSLRKLLTVAKECPEAFDFPQQMEDKYGTHKAGPEYKSAKNGRRFWYRGHMSTKELLELSGKEFKPYVDDPYEHAKDWDEYMDSGGSCGDSCEPFADGSDSNESIFTGDEE